MATGDREEAKNELVQSFLSVRRALGLLGFLLPTTLALVGLLVDGGIQSSISAMYHTSAGDILVGAMIAFAVFLWSYVGFKPRDGEVLSDLMISRLAALGAAGVALIPVSAPSGLVSRHPPALSGLIELPRLSNAVHYGSALLFFTCLALFSLVLFRRSDTTTPDRAKRGANLIHLIAGSLIATCTVLMAIYAVTFTFLSDNLQMRLDAYPVLYVLESIGIFAFGTSWLIKGKALVPLQAVAEKMVAASPP